MFNFSFQNVQTWVKVDQNVIDLYYKLFRSVCIAAVQVSFVSKINFNVDRFSFILLPSDYAGGKVFERLTSH